jgi:hypothetical protein
MDSIYTGSDRLEAYLAHHGIKGMHWGIRRYQRADGSLTPEGEARLARKQAKKEIKKIRKKGQRIGWSTGLVGQFLLARPITKESRQTNQKKIGELRKSLDTYAKSKDPEVVKAAIKAQKKLSSWEKHPTLRKVKADIKQGAALGVMSVGASGLKMLLAHSDLEDEAYLAHHGILGMHWGVRRYRPYPDDYTGSGKEVGEAAKKKPRKLSWKDAKHVAKNIDEYSDEEISDLVRRLNNRNNILDQLQRDKRRSREGAAYVRSSVKDVVSTFKDGVIMYDKIVNGGKKKKD